MILDLGDGRRVAISVEAWKRSGGTRVSGVRLGFDAPADVLILREELEDRAAAQRNGGAR